MRTLKLYITVYIFSGCLLMTSCKKFLDQEPISAATETNFWKTPGDAESGVAGGYSLLRTALTAGAIGYYAYGDLPTREFTSVSGEDLADVMNMNFSLAVPSSSTNRTMYKLRRWDNFYRVIDQASKGIRNIPSIDFANATNGATSKSLTGEAYFLRAFTYFYMVRIWGDVPLVPADQTAETAVNLPRTAQAIVLAQCISDLNAAIPMLEYAYTTTSNKAVRANKGAAYALLAHIYAWQQDYTNCVTAANLVNATNMYTLVDRGTNYLSIFKGQSSEGIFEISMNAQNETALTGIAQYTTKAPYNTTITGNAMFTINSSNLNALYSNTADLRRTNAFAFLDTTDPICIKYANFQYVTQNNTQTAVAYNNIIVFRLADIILLKAEALAALGRDTESIVELNRIRTAAGLPNYDGITDLFKAVIDERGRELFLEGHRYYDLVRFAKTKQVYEFGDEKMNSSTFVAGKYLWPIDPSLIALNNLLNQTPYWAPRM